MRLLSLLKEATSDTFSDMLFRRARAITLTGSIFGPMSIRSFFV